MKKKQLMAVFLALVLLLSVAAGCGSQAAQSATESSASAEAGQAAPEQTEAAEPEAAPETAAPSAEEAAASEAEEPEEVVVESAITFPLDEQETLSYWHDFDTSVLSYFPGGTMDDIPCYKAAAERTNVRLEHVTATGGTEADQFNLMCASGDFTDIIKNATALYSKGAVGALDDEVIIDLKPLLDEYAPHYVQALNMVDGYMRDISTDDSRLPTFVTVYVNGLDYSQGLWIRQDIFDAAGIETPVTYDDFTDALRKLKDYGVDEPLYMDPNGVFARNLMASGYGVAVSMLFGMGAAATEPFFQIDGRVTFGPFEPGWLEYVKMVRQWHSEGLIAKEFTTNAGMPLDSAFLSKVTTGEVGVFVAPVMLMDYITAAGVDYDPNFTPQAIPEPVVNVGDTPHFGQENQSEMLGGTSISTGCENPELAAAWCDFWYTEEGRMMATWGTEGVSYELDENGEPYWTDLILHNPDGLSRMMATWLYAIEIGTVNYAETDTTGYAQYLIDALEIWKANRDKAYDIPDTASFTSEESERYNELMGDIATYYQETFLRFLTEDISLDEYDNFVSSLKAMGVEECIEIKQAEYDRYMAR